MNLVPSAITALGLITVLVGTVSGQTTSLVSRDSGGNQGNMGSSYPSLSADGRFVAFYSEASNMVSGDTNGVGDVFWRDRRTGITIRVSVDSAGAQGNGASTLPSISADGRFVAFSSAASDLVVGDTNATDDVFVYDVLTHGTARVSVDSNGVESNGSSLYPSISADGRFVAFQSLGTNLVAGDTNGSSDIFVHDLQTGITTRVSTSSSGAEGDSDSLSPTISADGMRIAFASRATNFVAGGSIALGNIFVHDQVSGTTTCASLDLQGQPGGGCQGAKISGNGRVIAFESYCPSLVANDTNGLTDIFARDLATGTTTRVSVDSNGVQGNQISSYVSISFDGRFVAFGSQADNLVPNDTNGLKDIFVRDRRSHTTTRVNVNQALGQADGWSNTIAISANGRQIAFASDAENLVHIDANGQRDVFVRTLW